MAHSGTDRAGDELLEPEQEESALFPLPPPPLLPFLLDGRELTEWSTSPQLAILKYQSSFSGAVSLGELLDLQSSHVPLDLAHSCNSYGEC